MNIVSSYKREREGGIGVTDGIVKLNTVPFIAINIDKKLVARMSWSSCEMR